MGKRGNTSRIRLKKDRHMATMEVLYNGTSDGWCLPCAKKI
jgi:hypothetical protein